MKHLCVHKYKGKHSDFPLESRKTPRRVMGRKLTKEQNDTKMKNRRMTPTQMVVDNNQPR